MHTRPLTKSLPSYHSAFSCVAPCCLKVNLHTHKKNLLVVLRLTRSMYCTVLESSSVNSASSFKCSLFFKHQSSASFTTTLERAISDACVGTTGLQDRKRTYLLQHICTQTCLLKDPQPLHKQRSLPEIWQMSYSKIKVMGRKIHSCDDSHLCSLASCKESGILITTVVLFKPKAGRALPVRANSTNATRNRDAFFQPDTAPQDRLLHDSK